MPVTRVEGDPFAGPKKVSGNPFAPKAKRVGVVEAVTGAVAGAADRLKTRVERGVADTAAGKPVAMTEGLGLLADTAGLVASPVAGLIQGAVVEPAARVMDRLPAPLVNDTPAKAADPRTWARAPSYRPATPQEQHDINTGMVSTSLMAAGPGRTSARGLVTPKPPGRVAAMAEKFDRAGVSPMVAASGGKGTSAVTNAVAENPIAGGLVRSRLNRALDETETAAGGLARQYGEVRGPQITGENVQSGVTRFARDGRDPTSFAAKSRTQYEAVFNDLDNAMAGKQTPGSSQVSTASTTRVLGEVNNSTQSAAIGELIADPTLNKAANAIAQAQGAKDLSFGDLRRLRTWVRDAQKDPELRQKIGPANLQRLEGALTEDIYANAEQLGSPDLARRLRRADQYYAAGQQRIQNALQSFADAQSGESAYRRIEQAAGSTGSADAAKLLSLKRSLSADEWGDVAANVISEMGKPTPGQAAANEAGFSVAQFVTRYNRLSPRGRDVLFGATGGGGARATALRSELDNLAEVADTLKGIEKGANVSKTAVAGQTIATGAGLLTPATALPTAGGLGAMALTGEILTNPAAVRWIVALGRAQQQGAPAVTATVRRLESASRLNAALLPVYQESLKLLPAPSVIAKAAAEPQDQEPVP